MGNFSKSSVSVPPNREIFFAGTGGYKLENFAAGGDFGGYHATQGNAVRGNRMTDIVPGATMNDPSNSGAKIPLNAIEAQRRAEAIWLKRGHANVDAMMAARSGLPQDEQPSYGFVATRNKQHPIDAMAMLNGGMGVLTEKPFAITNADADAVLEKVTDSGLPFVTAYTYTNYPAVMQARELVLNGDIGKIVDFDAEYIQGWLESSANDAAIWRTDPAEAGAGATGDILTHIYELLRFTTGSDITELKAETSQLAGRQVDDNVRVEAKLENGAPVRLRASQTTSGAENDIKFKIEGTKGRIEWTMDDPNILTVTKHGSKPERLSVSNGNPQFSQRVRDQIPGPGKHPFGNTDAIRRMHQVMSNELRDKPNYHYSGVHSAAAGTKFVNAVLESAKLGRAITITPVGNPDLSTYKTVV